MPGDPGSPSLVTRDIGEGGVFLFTERRWPVGAWLTLAIRHRRDAIAVVGRVERHESSGVALSFQNQNPRVQHAIRELVSKLFAEGVPHDEQRRAARAGGRATVAWMEGDERRTALLEDISAGGARIVTDGRPDIGAVVMLYLPAAEGSAAAVGCSAAVVRHTSGGFAVEFDAPSEQFLGALKQLQSGR